MSYNDLSCPRCSVTSGMTTNRDEYGSYLECIYCGYMKDVFSKQDILINLRNTRIAKKSRAMTLNQRIRQGMRQ